MTSLWRGQTRAGAPRGPPPRRERIRIPVRHKDPVQRGARVTRGRHSSLCRDTEFVPLAAVSVAMRQSPLESLGLPTKRFTEIGLVPLRSA